MSSRSRSRTFKEYDRNGSPIGPLKFSSSTFGESISDHIGEGRFDHPATHTRTILAANSGACRLWTSPSGSGSAVDPRTIVASGYYAVTGYESNDYGLALTKAQSSLVSACAEAGRTNFHAISFLRELGETYAMLRNPFGLVGNIRKAVREGSALRKKYRRWNRFCHGASVHTPLKKYVKAAEDTWLEGTYGWQPFVGDLLSARKILSAVRERRKILNTRELRPFEIRTTGGTSTVSNGTPTNWKQFGYIGGYTSKTTCTMWATLGVNPAAAGENAFMSAVRALNIDRLGYAVWDAVPYSFVVDWWFPLGDRVDSLLSGPALLTSIGNPWVALRTLARYEYNLFASPLHPAHPSGGGTYIEEQLSFSRYASKLSLCSDVDNSTGMHGTRIPSGLALGHGLLSRIAQTCKRLRS